MYLLSISKSDFEERKHSPLKIPYNLVLHPLLSLGEEIFYLQLNELKFTLSNLKHFNSPSIITKQKVCVSEEDKNFNE